MLACLFSLHKKGVYICHHTPPHPQQRAEASRQPHCGAGGRSIQLSAEMISASGKNPSHDDPTVFVFPAVFFILRQPHRVVFSVIN